MKDVKLSEFSKKRDLIYNLDRLLRKNLVSKKEKARPAFAFKFLVKVQFAKNHSFLLTVKLTKESMNAKPEETP